MLSVVFFLLTSQLLLSSLYIVGSFLYIKMCLSFELQYRFAVKFQCQRKLLLLLRVVHLLWHIFRSLSTTLWCFHVPWCRWAGIVGVPRVPVWSTMEEGMVFDSTCLRGISVMRFKLSVELSFVISYINTAEKEHIKMSHRWIQDSSVTPWGSANTSTPLLPNGNLSRAFSGCNDGRRWVELLVIFTITINQISSFFCLAGGGRCRIN